LCRRLPSPCVDLTDPDTEIHVFVTACGCRWGVLLWGTDSAGFEARRAHRRPFWRSIAMPPRRARCLVNLSRVRPGGTLLDPFCGTGSVPIESALLGVRTYASDVDPVIVAGAGRNFQALGLAERVDLRQLDARAWGARPERFDAIVSDLPYGRTASVKGVDRDVLYREFLDATARVLLPGGRAVVMLPEGALPPLLPGIAVQATFAEVVHASLTREIVVLQKVR
jgi:tRNA (guanine10-N2)-dimethyltransferase